MSIRKHVFVGDEYYHIYNRGNSKQVIFHDKEDCYRFMALMYACNSTKNYRSFILKKNITPYDFDRETQLVAIGVYCLMPNHFHLLIKQKIVNGISLFMQKLMTAYVMYYNKKYKRTGALFEGKFKSTHVDSDIYLKYLFSYIHLNPVKLIQSDWKINGIKNIKETFHYLQTYEYSSFSDYISKNRIQNGILNREDFPQYFDGIKNMMNEMISWLTFKTC